MTKALLERAMQAEMTDHLGYEKHDRAGNNSGAIERPRTEVLYISDLTESVAVESISKRKPEAMLSKPFTASQLLDRIRQVLAA